jgi:hypothetical protein
MNGIFQHPEVMLMMTGGMVLEDGRKSEDVEKPEAI